MSTILLSAIILVIFVIIVAISMLKQSQHKKNRYIRRQSKLMPSILNQSIDTATKNKPFESDEINYQSHQKNENNAENSDENNLDQKNKSDDFDKNKIEDFDADEVLGLKKVELGTRWKAFSENNKDNNPEKAKSNHDNSEEKMQEAANTQQSIIVLYVMADDSRPYTGYELLQALLSAGLRYGKMNIFHRFESKNGLGDILFSVASAVKPGTFDLQNMGCFSCTGLTLFFVMEKAKEPLQVFECMLETTGQLVEGLGGKVYDSKRNLLTRDKVIAIRKQIRAFENSQQTADLFAGDYVEVDPS